MTRGARKAVVDIGIPVTRRREYVGAAVESVLGQSFSDWQLVISQDGPRDEEIAATLEPYLGDPRIEYVTAATSGGAAVNKTRILAHGTAPFVALLDDDDLWKPHFLEKQLEFLGRHEAAAFVFTANDVVDSDGRLIGKSRTVLPTGVYEPADFMPVLVRHNVIATPTVVVRRAAYESVGAAFDARLPTMYDYDMWLRIAARHAVGYRESWDACYRHHGGQQTIGERARRAEQMLLIVGNIESILEANRGLSVPAGVVRHKRARALLSHALDEFEDGRPRAGRAAVVAALRASPRAVVDPKFPLAVASPLVGRVAAPLLRRVRVFNLRRGLTGGRLDRGTIVRLRARAVREWTRPGRLGRNLDRP